MRHSIRLLSYVGSWLVPVTKADRRTIFLDLVKSFRRRTVISLKSTFDFSFFVGDAGSGPESAPSLASRGRFLGFYLNTFFFLRRIFSLR